MVQHAGLIVVPELQLHAKCQLFYFCNKTYISHVLPGLSLLSNYRKKWLFFQWAHSEKWKLDNREKWGDFWEKLMVI